MLRRFFEGLLLVALLDVTAAAVCRHKKNGLYAISDCDSSLYSCVDGQFQLQQCPSSLIFNDDSGFCEFLEDVQSCTNGLAEVYTYRPLPPTTEAKGEVFVKDRFPVQSDQTTPSTDNHGHNEGFVRDVFADDVEARVPSTFSYRPSPNTGAGVFVKDRFAVDSDQTIRSTDNQGHNEGFVRDVFADDVGARVPGTFSYLPPSSLNVEGKMFIKDRFAVETDQTTPSIIEHERNEMVRDVFADAGEANVPYPFNPRLISAQKVLRDEPVRVFRDEPVKKTVEGSGEEEQEVEGSGDEPEPEPLQKGRTKRSVQEHPTGLGCTAWTSPYVVYNCLPHYHACVGGKVVKRTCPVGYFLEPRTITCTPIDTRNGCFKHPRAQDVWEAKKPEIIVLDKHDYLEKSSSTTAVPTTAFVEDDVLNVTEATSTTVAPTTAVTEASSSTAVPTTAVTEAASSIAVPSTAVTEAASSTAVPTTAVTEAASSTVVPSTAFVKDDVLNVTEAASSTAAPSTSFVEDDVTEAATISPEEEAPIVRASTVSTPCGNRTDGLYRNPVFCSQIIQCFGGKAYAYPPCDNVLVFNEESGLCDLPKSEDFDSGCKKIEEQNVTAESDSQESGVTCTMDQHGDFIVHESDCNLYYRCIWGVARLKHCPPETVFNDLLSVCDYPQNVERCRKP